MLVFDEEKQYEKLVAYGFERFPNKRDLVILCKKWLQNGTNFYALKEKMVEFCKTFNPQFNYAKTESLILKVLKEVDIEHPKAPKFVYCTRIEFTESELVGIKSLKTRELQSVMFVIMTLAKWRNANYIYINTNSSIKLSDIFGFAGIKCTGARQKEILRELYLKGALRVDLKPLLKVWPNFFFVGGPSAAYISFDIGDDMLSHWEEYACPKCEVCGKPFWRVTNNQKYCKDCAKRIKQDKINQIKREKRRNNSGNCPD